MSKPQRSAGSKPVASQPGGVMQAQQIEKALQQPGVMAKAIAARELQELEQGARAGWKPAIEELAKRNQAKA